VLAIHPGNPNVKKSLGQGVTNREVNTVDTLMDLVRCVPTVLAAHTHTHTQKYVPKQSNGGDISSSANGVCESGTESGRS
jgi:hypothetical protein